LVSPSLACAISGIGVNKRYRTDCHRHPKFVLRAQRTPMDKSELITCGIQTSANRASLSDFWFQSGLDEGKGSTGQLSIFQLVHIPWLLSAIARQLHVEFKMTRDLDTGAHTEGVVQLLRLRKSASRARRGRGGHQLRGSSSSWRKQTAYLDRVHRTIFADGVLWLPP